MKAKYVNPFLSASLNLFRDYLGIAVTAGTPYVKEEPNQLDEVSAIIGLAGETTGAVVLSFSKACALKIVGVFSGTEHAFLSNEVLDGVGELVNIIAGNAKKDLLEFRIEISLPGVITGNDNKIKWPSGAAVICIPFQSEAGDFSVNVSLREIV